MSWQKGCPVIVYRNTLQGQQELESFLSEAKDNAIENRKGGCFCMCVFCFVLLNTTSLRVKGQTFKDNLLYCGRVLSIGKYNKRRYSGVI